MTLLFSSLDVSFPLGEHHFSSPSLFFPPLFDAKEFFFLMFPPSRLLESGGDSFLSADLHCLPSVEFSFFPKRMQALP